MRPHLGICFLCLGSTALLAPSQAAAGTSTATLVAKGNFVAPRFSPDGNRLLITGERMHGIGEITVANGDVRWLLDEARVGVHSHYRPDGTVGFRAKRAGVLRDLSVDAKGSITQTKAAPAKVFAHGDKIYLRSNTGVIKVSSGDRFFAPSLSPDKSKIAFTGLATGVHVYDITTRNQVYVGTGTAPTWSPNSQHLAFERTEDDGHNIVGSELWLWSPAQGARPLTNTPALLERNPSWSPDGTKLAFDDDRGAVYLTDVVAPL